MGQRSTSRAETWTKCYPGLNHAAGCVQHLTTPLRQGLALLLRNEFTQTVLLLQDQCVPALECLRPLTCGCGFPARKGRMGGIHGGSGIGCTAVGHGDDQLLIHRIGHRKDTPIDAFTPLASDEVQREDDFGRANGAGCVLVHVSRAAMARPMSVVEASPPKSRVRGPSASTPSIAATMASCAARSPRKSSISAPDQIMATGLAMFWP